MGISLAVLSTEARDTDQATVFPHSLEFAVSAGRTLSIASWLSTTDRSTAGSKVGGASVEAWGFFFPFPFQLGAMAVGKIESWLNQRRGPLFPGRWRSWGAHCQR